ncbi:hypothetical protein OUZ56_026639 [Daphnia magna]|uniref:Uncharacterized protein n=1 Tax=Daphnia magna TaxID=35525 RepID=A0ABQ9ZNQ3_9CRUS|nr:hypothetical protein OUZ56_026639 [Daphnia magna]
MTDVENKATANRLCCKSAKFITAAILKNGGRSNRSHRRTALKPICFWRTRIDRNRSSIFLFRVDQIGLPDLGKSGLSPTSPALLLGLGPGSLENPGYPRIVAKNSRPCAIRVAYLPKWVGWADLMGKPGIPTTILESGGLQSAKLNHKGD